MDLLGVARPLIMQMSIQKNTSKFINWPNVTRLFQTFYLGLERRVELSGSIHRTCRCFAIASLIALIPLSPVQAEGEYNPSQAAAALTRADVDQLLTQARSAMAAGKLEQADAYIRRAEASKVRYPMLHFGDTPARVRAEFNKLANGAQNSNTKNPIANLLPQSAPETKDPFAQATQLGNSIPSNQIVTQNPIAQPSNQNSSKELSDAALLSARQALAVGDTEKAKQFLAVASGLAIEYSPAEDSPQRISQSIHDLDLLQTNKEDSPSWRQGYTKFLVTQAAALVNWGDLDNAERTANEAAALSADIEIQGTTPSNVLQVIAQMRAGNVPTAAPTQDPATLMAAKAETSRLLAQARQALASGNLPVAESLAVQASQLGVAETNFAAHEDRPSKLAADLQRARAEMQQVILASEASPTDLALPSANDAVGNPPRLAQLPEVTPAPLPAPNESLPASADAFQLIQSGETALRNGNRQAALKMFRSAYAQRDQLDPQTLDPTARPLAYAFG